VELVATVSLTVTNSFGCHSTVSRPDIVKIIPALTASFTSDKRVLCLVTDAVQFSNASTGPGTLDYLWDFGDGNTSTQQSPSHVFNKKGNYSVSMKVHSSEGCTLVAQQSNALNVANYSTDIGVPSPICKDNYVNFSDNSSPRPDISVWEVDGVPQYGYGSMSYNFSVVGNHTVVLKNTYGTCPLAKTVTVSVKDLPYPTGFTSTITGKCGAPVAVNFSDATPGAVKWAWDFNYYYYNNPNITAASQAPSYTYQADGNYQVYLRVTNADGCSNSITQNVQISRPTASISAAGPGTLSSCASLLTNTFSTISSEPLTVTKWNFGDGGTSTDPNPTHTFKNNGTYTVTLNYTTQNGCTGSTSIYQFPISQPSPVTIYTTPGNPVSCKLPLTVTFGTNSSVTLATTNWVFGDGALSTDPAPTHTYAPYGHYVVVLNYVTQSGCKGSASGPVVVVDPKITALDFSMSPNPVCGSNSVTFSTTPNNYYINSWNWDFGDGGINFSTGSPSYSYSSPGTYTVKLYARNVGGCDTSMSKTIVVKPPFPRITSHINTCDGTRGLIHFTQASIQATTVTWNFGDGTTATVPGTQLTMDHTYTRTGVYSVYLTATNGSCTLTYNYPYPVNVLLKQAPLLTGSRTAVCSNTPVDIQISKLDKNPLQGDQNYNSYYYAGYYFTGTEYGDGSAFQGDRTDAGYYYRWTTTYNATMNNFRTGKKHPADHDQLWLWMPGHDQFYAPGRQGGHGWVQGHRR